MRYTIYFIISLTFISFIACGEPEKEQSYYNPQKILMDRQEKISFFHLSQDSPMNNDDRNSRKPLNYYPPDSNYVVRAVLVPASKKDTLYFPTTNDSIQKPMKLMGKLSFVLNGSKRELQAFIPIRALQENPEGPHSLFIPFTDNTNSSETYKGGRYIDIQLSEGYEYIIDFNEAYNPYCVYDTGFSCPIVPEANHLDTEVKAGEMNFE